MKLKTYFCILFLVAVGSFQMNGQSVDKRYDYYSSVAFYHILGGNSFQETQAISFTRRFSLTSLWGGTLSVGHTGAARENEYKAYFASLLCTVLPIENTRFRIIPSLGVGIAEGKDSDGKFTRLFFDSSVDAQYFVSNNIYCGGEYRYMTNGKKSFSFHLMGLKIGFTF